MSSLEVFCQWKYYSEKKELGEAFSFYYIVCILKMQTPNNFEQQKNSTAKKHTDLNRQVTYASIPYSDDSICKYLFHSKC